MCREVYTLLMDMEDIDELESILLYRYYILAMTCDTSHQFMIRTHSRMCERVSD